MSKDQPSPSAKPWGGRFAEPTDALVEAFSASVHYDHRLARHDIAGSIAHARMLEKAGVLSAADCQSIVAGLEAIRAEIDEGTFEWSAALEDVHMNIEARLTARIGEAGKRLHTARSRNDQVATDLRLWLRDELREIDGILVALQTALVDLAEREADTILPGFTHMQPAQPVSFGHHLLAWFEMIARDRERFADCARRADVMPLGSAALAGTSFPIDREFTAKQLGFARVSENSLDAVSDRDFAIEFCAASGLCMTHLSRFSEELVLWSSPSYGFVRLPDRFCTGSSIMPQKKNPDVPELVRGKTGRVTGHLVALLTLMKAQPLAYNRDNQEDKEALFDTVDTLKACIRLYAALVPAIEPDRPRMREAAVRGHTTATDLADWLVRKGVPFRDAHEIVGRAVGVAVARGVELSALTLDDLRAVSPLIDADALKVLSVEGSVAARDHFGGTAPAQVRAAVKRARGRIGR